MPGTCLRESVFGCSIDASVTTPQVGVETVMGMTLTERFRSLSRRPSSCGAGDTFTQPRTRAQPRTSVRWRHSARETWLRYRIAMRRPPEERPPRVGGEEGEEVRARQPRGDSGEIRRAFSRHFGLENLKISFLLRRVGCMGASEFSPPSSPRSTDVFAPARSTASAAEDETIAAAAVVVVVVVGGPRQEEEVRVGLH